MRYHDLATRLNALRCRLFGVSDKGRWADAAAFDDWSERTRLLAGFVEPGWRVLELGAGGRRLQRWLDPSCRYTPADIVSRGEDALVFDFNQRPLPAIGPFDVAVLAGVLEYVADAPGFLAWLAGVADRCACSYGCVASAPGTLARMKDEVARNGAGWVNSFDEAELVRLFAAAGYRLARTGDWRTEEGDERLFLFERAL